LSDISRGVDLLIGGWQLNTNITIQSGPPFTVLANGRRVDVVASGTTVCRIAGVANGAPKIFDGQTLCPAATRVFASDPDLNPDGTIANVPRFGNLGRNPFRGDRQEFVDASLFKNLHISEGFNIQFRAQAYNLFNHVNGFRPVNDFNSTSFGIDTAEQRRRQLEFGMRMIF
jgi:hypothetical protein